MTGAVAVRVWAIALRQPPGTVARLSALLGPDERRRAECDPRYAVAHAAVRQILGAHLGCPAGELRRALGPHGKPRLLGPGADLAWNLSAGDDWALLALVPGADDGGADAGAGCDADPDTDPAPGPRPARPAVGIDVQRLVPGPAALRLARRYYPGPEADLVTSAAGPEGASDVYTRLWTYKEAYVKAFGGRLMNGLPTQAPPPGPPAPMAGPLGTCWVAACVAPAGYRAAVAVTGPLPPRTYARTWDAASLHITAFPSAN